MLTITELKAKATANGMSIKDADNGLYQVYSGNQAIGNPATLESLNNADDFGLFDPIEEVQDIEFLCTNGSNSSFRVMAVEASEALKMAVRGFDESSDYILPISVSSECGLVASVVADDLGDDYAETEYSAESLGLNDDF